MNEKTKRKGKEERRTCIYESTVVYEGVELKLHTS
jgi:hypothetical protein